MDTVNLMSVYCCFESLICIILRCLYHLNFWSSQILRNLADSIGVISVSESRIICLGRMYAWVKCISSLFSGANVIPLVTVHLSYTAYMHSRCLQFVVILLLYMIRLVSFANPTTMILSSSSSLYNEAIYRMNRIGNNDNPYGISVWSSRRAASVSLNWRCIVCASR